MKREISLIIAATAAIANAKDTCNALVLSGGGSNGAWEIGMLWGLLNYGDPKDFEWDWMTGVSAGGINTAAMSGWPVGSETEAVEWLSEIFTTLSSDQIWQTWPEGVEKSVLGNPSLLDDSPAILFMEKILSDPRFTNGFQRDFSIGSENINTGEYHIFTRDNVTFGSELAQAALASGSIPVVF